MKRKNNKKKNNLIEIVRSFSYKLNLGNYQTADFFCSQKAECRQNERSTISTNLHDFCKAEVIKSANAYREILKKEQEKRKNELAGKIKAQDVGFEPRDVVETSEKELASEIHGH